MANASSWSKSQPSGASLIRDGDDLMRSDKSILQATLEQEHYFTDGSAASAGVHKLGSARVYVGTRSQVSTVADNGRLMWTTDDEQMHVLSSTSTVRLPSLRTANTWTGAQAFAAVVSTGTASTTGAANGDLVVSHGKALRSGNTAGTGTVIIASVNTLHEILLGSHGGTGDSLVKLNTTSNSLEAGMLLYWHNGSAWTHSRVKIGASGTGPSGTGRALYVDV